MSEWMNQSINQNFSHVSSANNESILNSRYIHLRTKLFLIKSIWVYNLVLKYVCLKEKEK